MTSVGVVPGGDTPPSKHEEKGRVGFHIDRKEDTIDISADGIFSVCVLVMMLMSVKDGNLGCLRE